jgi:serine protease AprX
MIDTIQASCPICRRDVPATDFLGSEGLEPQVVALAVANAPGWTAEQGLCRDCAHRFITALAYLRAEHPQFISGNPRAILPTAVRLGAVGRLRGAGVTVAFLDSGFYAHPDLVKPKDRILRYVDITNPRARREDLDAPSDSAWHGMMTSVVACGSGRLSGGLYRGLASEARLVLVKVGSMSRIRHDDIQRGLEWILRNRKRFDIRIVNVSCGGDYEASYLTDALSLAVERCTSAGILVCCAAGNLGHAPNHPVLPPASAPSAVTVGALDDKNQLSFSGWEMYHSSYGPTIDGFLKPEVIAPGIWVAAPILPGTPTAAQADLLVRLDAAPDDQLDTLMDAAPGIDPELDAARAANAPLRPLVASKMRSANLVTGHYKHVDGTSFAAPIVSSVAAQMIEANPELTPLQIKRLLIGTARRLPHVDVDRQGWGVVDPERAVLAALQTRSGARPDVSERRAPGTERRRAGPRRPR